MGFSTVRISRDQAIKETSGQNVYRTTEASTEELFCGFGYEEIKTVEKTDHIPPRYIFKLIGDRFAQLEKI